MARGKRSESLVKVGVLVLADAGRDEISAVGHSITVSSDNVLRYVVDQGVTASDEVRSRFTHEILDRYTVCISMIVKSRTAAFVERVAIPSVRKNAVATARASPSNEVFSSHSLRRSLSENGTRLSIVGPGTKIKQTITTTIAGIMIPIKARSPVEIFCFVKGNEISGSASENGRLLGEIRESTAPTAAMILPDGSVNKSCDKIVTAFEFHNAESTHMITIQSKI